MAGEAQLTLRARASALKRDLEVMRMELREVEAALARLDDGTWGRCEACGGAIGRIRLRALPEARRCATCATGA